MTACTVSGAPRTKSLGACGSLGRAPRRGTYCSPRAEAIRAGRRARVLAADNVCLSMDHVGIPIWRESRILAERAGLRRRSILRGEGVPRGDGAPVLLIPGFLAGDPTLAPMARWLRDLGYRPCRARIRANVDCSGRAVDRLEAELERLAERHGCPVALVGHSRGGSMARILAVRRPDLVRAAICLGSPLGDQLAVHPLVRAHVALVAALGSLGVPGLFRRGCSVDDCCARVREQSAAPFPPDVRLVSIFSRSDGVVDWRACLDPAAEAIEVRSSHCGMAVNAAVFAAIAGALAKTTAAAGRRGVDAPDKPSGAVPA